MTVGKNQYNEADLLRMQRDAEARVREMHKRARQTVEEANNGTFQPRYRGWSQNPGMRRPQMNNMNGRRREPGPNRPDSQPQPPPPEREKHPPDSPPHDPAPPIPDGEKKSGTIVGDIMAALGLDEDYLLIIGLILILVNQRADTTLILALAYLLI